MGIFFVNFKAYADAVLNTTGTSPGAEFAGIAASGYFTYIGLGFLGYLLTVLFAALDWRRLKLNGVPRPFHWAWAFLGQSIVYMIGRSVVVHRRTNRGLAPLWVWIAVYVVAIVIVSTVAVGAMADAVQQLGQFGNP
jgi:hypothetical protein